MELVLKQQHEKHNINLLDIAQYNNKIAINEYQIDKYLNTLQRILIE